MSKINTWWQIGLTVPMTEKQVKNLSKMTSDEFMKIIKDGLKSKEVCFSFRETDIEDEDEYLEDCGNEIFFDL